MKRLYDYPKDGKFNINSGSVGIPKILLRKSYKALFLGRHDIRIKENHLENNIKNKTTINHDNHNITPDNALKILNDTLQNHLYTYEIVEIEVTNNRPWKVLIRIHNCLDYNNEHWDVIMPILIWYNNKTNEAINLTIRTAWLNRPNDKHVRLVNKDEYVNYNGDM